MKNIVTIFQAFAVLAFLPFVTPDSGYHPPSPYHPPKPHYEVPKHNCSISEVTEIGEVCTPSIITACNKNTLPIKIIKEAPFTYKVEQSVCTETIEIVNVDVCKFTYDDKEEETTAKVHLFLYLLKI